MSKTFQIIVLFAYFLNACALNIDCQRPPQLVDPHTCCSDGGRDEITEKCATKFGIFLNKMQSPPSAETASCLAECVLTEPNYLVGQNLNIAAIQMDLQRKFPQDPEYVAVMVQSYQKCFPIAQKKMDEIRKSPQGAALLQSKCSPLSGIILGCTYTEYFQHCPVKHWNPNADCEISKQFLQKCALY